MPAIEAETLKDHFISKVSYCNCLPETRAWMYARDLIPV
jgi:hypothetical protein